MKAYLMPTMTRLYERFARLYGNDAERCIERFSMMLGRYGVGLNPVRPEQLWDQADAVLITYGNSICSPDEKPLKTLGRFLKNNLEETVNTVHILPFFPYSSDDGFSVIDYVEVDEELGDWQDIRDIGEHFHLVFDLVLNHVSRKSSWFKDYINGVSPGRGYFVEADPEWDLSGVVRPRSHSLLTMVETRLGSKYVWTTFSDDQIDLDFSNPDVLFEFLDILFAYIDKGVRIVRLDAIAYLWKKVGTSCIHLPEVHDIVRLIRDVLEIVAPHVLVLTETNVPHEENISYFGIGDQAHMVYQFTLPPLLLHALQTGQSTHMTKWANSLQGPLPGCTFFNFTASHDGIGVRPLEGIVPQKEIDKLVKGIVRRRGKVSTKQNPDGSESPYELNITYLDALSDPDNNDQELHIERFLCSQAVMLAFRGIPAIYIHSLFGTRNDYKGVKATGRARSINRHKWDEQALNKLLCDADSMQARIHAQYVKVLIIRSQHLAFHPDGPQKVIDMGNDVFAIERTAPDGSESILALNNFTDHNITVNIAAAIGNTKPENPLQNIITGDIVPTTKNTIQLKPYQTLWLTQTKQH